MTFWQPFTGHHFSFKPFRPCLPADFQRAGPGLFPLLTAMLRIETTDSAFVTLSGMGQKMPLGIGVHSFHYIETTLDNFSNYFYLIGISYQVGPARSRRLKNRPSVDKWKKYREE